ncbi:MAG: exonuclease domain-containing protein [Candidatus Omnitrophota bacterium]|jgi:DNA polymerase III epsilon subunit family exonuclease
MMRKKLEEVEFTIFDTETTGLDPRSGDRIVEIAGLRFLGERKIAVFQTLVNPQRLISPGAFLVNQITQEELRGAPRMLEVIPEFLNFIRGSCLCSYNAPFDLEFLKIELGLAGACLPEETVIVDILSMARKLLPGQERYALWFISQKLGIHTQQKHRAFSDVEMTWEVFLKLRLALEQKGITDFRDFVSLFGVQADFLEDNNNQKVAEIQEAIGLGVKLKIRYFSSSAAAVSEREVIPRSIKQDKRRQYLVGFCCLRNEERTFRIDGILHLEII